MRSLFLLGPVWLMCASTVWGQADTAAVSGRVTDASGAVIIGADVTITNTSTGISNQMKTNESGVYNFSALPPGPYNLVVRAPGFQQVKREGLVLHVQDRINENVTPPIGS